MVTKCFRRGCNFREEADHMDDAIYRLRQHFRAIHPTKVFYESDYSANLEGYNLTVEEIFEGSNIARGDAAAPEYDWRHIRAQVHTWRRNQERGNDYLDPAVLDEVERRVNEWFANQPAPAAEAGGAAPANPFAGNNVLVDAVRAAPMWDVAPEEGVMHEVE